MTTDRLLDRAQNGDPEAVEELCQREWRPVFSELYRTLGNRAEAEDLTQEVFVRALRSLNRFEQTGTSFRAYLVTIARNLVRSKWRRKIPQQVAIDIVPEIHSTERGPEAELLSNERRRQIQQALGDLSPDYRTVIRLRLLDERPTDEVAALMNRSDGAVRVLLHRALTALRAHLHEGASQ